MWYYVAVAQRPNRLKILKSPSNLLLNGDFIIVETHLISQLTKLIETQYKEKAVLPHQLAQLEQQKVNVDEKILSFEKTLTLIDPDFDLRKIKTEFNTSQLIKRCLFRQDF
ncbi:hypothetical protein [Haemophilus parainfluenzae]|jgi:hypothetical protein|uniref:hypothetical protein n=1 Tax=Haemophilus parainfluenzae TaxID=729 RepID=UPI0008031AE9|nr:hypothetical protein [Haemophilus parainfluenzae]OBX69910.1 hypothetical protein A9297_05975 [Haemophilus parainfluenzae]